jgi:YARHG domain/TIR domain
MGPAPIFISHRAEYGAIARGLKEVIETGAQRQIEVFISEDIPRGKQWRQSIEEQLRKADSLFLIHGAPYEDWSWCFYEAGYFTAVEPGPSVAQHRIFVAMLRAGLKDDDEKRVRIEGQREDHGSGREDAAEAGAQGSVDALGDARAAIVIWTPTSIKSRWVLGEAEAAATAEKLVPVRDSGLSENQLPIGFRALHTIPFEDSDGLLEAIRRRLSTVPVEPLSRWDLMKIRFGRRLLAARRWWTWRAAAAAVVLVGLAAYGFAMVMSWETIKASADPQDFKGYLSTFPIGPYATEARTKLTGIGDEWKEVKTSRNIDKLQDYVKKFPSSLYDPYVRLRLSRLQAVATQKYKRIMPQALVRALTAEEIDSLDCTKLWIARNEIYYALGRCFVSQNAEDIFHTRAECPSDCKMIATYNSFTDEVVSRIEIDNITALENRETKISCLALASSCGRGQ